MNFIKKYGFSLFIATLLAMNIAFIIANFTLKNTYHIDEQWSYAHANSKIGPYIARSTDNQYKWLDASMYKKYLTVQKNDKFSYRHIWTNLENDMHTPLYFMMLYTVNYFFPDVMSVWTGASLNIFLWLATLITMYFLSKKLIQNKYILWIPIILYAFSLIGISTVMYIRIYMLQTLLATCLIYEIVNYTQQDIPSKKTLFKIFLYSTLGMLTAYTSIVLSFFISVCYGIYLLSTKKYKSLVFLAITMILSLIALVCIFPPVLNVLVRHSKDATIPLEYAFFANLEYYFTDLFNINFNLFNHIYIALFLFFIFLCITAVYFYCSKKETKKLYIPLFFTLLFTHCFLAYKMPQMWEFRNRYTMLLYPAISILTVGVLWTILRSLVKEKYLIIALYLILGVNFFYANYGRYCPYLMHYNMNIQQMLEQTKGKKVIIISPIKEGFDAGAYLYPKMEAVYFLPYDFYYHTYFIEVCPKKNKLCGVIANDLQKADYIFVFGKERVSLKYDTTKILLQPDPKNFRPGLKYLKTIKLGASLVFDIFKVEDFSPKNQNKAN